MYSLKNFTVQKWLLLSLFFFTITFLLAYFTGITGETKRWLLSNPSLIRRAIMSLLIGIVVSFAKLVRD